MIAMSWIATHVKRRRRAHSMWLHHVMRRVVTMSHRVMKRLRLVWRVGVVRAALVRVAWLLGANRVGETHRHRYAAATTAVQSGEVGEPTIAVISCVVV